MDSINLHDVTHVEVKEAKTHDGTTYRQVIFCKKHVPGEGTRGLDVTFFGNDVPFTVEGKITEKSQ